MSTSSSVFLSLKLFPPVRSLEATEPGLDASQKPSQPAVLLFSLRERPHALIRGRIACRSHSVKVYRWRTTSDVPGNKPYTAVRLRSHGVDRVPCGSHLCPLAIFRRRAAMQVAWEIVPANQDGAYAVTLRAGQEAVDSNRGYRPADQAP